MYKLKHQNTSSKNYYQQQQKLLQQPQHCIIHTKKEDPFSLFRKSIFKEIDFDKLECLQTICIASQINYIKMVEWAQEMYRVLNQLQFSVKAESLSKIEFKDALPKKQAYYLSIKAFSNELLYAVVRDYQGDIILYQTFQADAKIQYVLSMLQTHALQNSLIVHDQSANETDCLYFLQVQNVKYKFVYILNHQIPTQSMAEMQEYFTFHSINNVSVFYPRETMKNLGIVEQKICKIYKIEHQEASRLHFLLGETILSYYPDRYYFLSKLISEKNKILSEALTKDLLANYLAQTSSYLKLLLNKITQSTNTHLPKRGQTKSICYFCRKRKTEAVCDGCFKIQLQNRHLCIGSCFKRYHLYIQSISTQLNEEATIKIKSFDQTCSQIQQTMNQLLKCQSGSQIVESFIGMSNCKLMNLINFSVQRHLQNEIKGEDE